MMRSPFLFGMAIESIGSFRCALNVELVISTVLASSAVRVGGVGRSRPESVVARLTFSPHSWRISGVASLCGGLGIPSWPAHRRAVVQSMSEAP